jgi:hypothetical protein
VIAEALVQERQHSRVDRLAELIVQELDGAADGHCARVNFLEREEAEAVCRRLRGTEVTGTADLNAYVLIGAGERTDDSLALTADRAIELRNRKRGRLCLFVPADLVDATLSSLGNSFAEIDGRILHRRALEELSRDLGSGAREVVRRLRAELARGSGISDDEQLEFALAAAEHERTGQLDSLGLELWRVGLIADARPDFELHLPANRRSARRLARPQRLGASPRDRIASLKVASETARELEAFFARRPMHDVRRWSRELAEGEGPTFDRWTFPEAIRTNLETVRVKPFTDEHGAVLRTSKLLQPDGAGGTLFALCGEKETISVRWETDPLTPINVQAWEVSLIPTSGGESDELAVFDLPSREVKGSVRTARVKLDLDFDEPPETSFSVRVVAIDETGNEVIGAEGEPISAASDEFFLTRVRVGLPKGDGQRRRTVATIAEGRLRAAVESKDRELALTQPGWAEGHGLVYFTARANERMLLNIAMSKVLKELEERTISKPRGGGRWVLAVDEVRAVSPEAITAAPFIEAEDGPWSEFWRVRSSFFEKLRHAGLGDLIEAADWTAELTNAGLRYAQVYTALLDTTRPSNLLEALTLDTLLVRLDRGDDIEDAAVILPTHPLRVAWFAAHAALLRSWEERVLKHERGGRKRLVDLDLVRDLRPANRVNSRSSSSRTWASSMALPYPPPCPTRLGDSPTWRFSSDSARSRPSRMTGVPNVSPTTCGTSSRSILTPIPSTSRSSIPIRESSSPPPWTASPGPAGLVGTMPTRRSSVRPSQPWTSPRMSLTRGKRDSTVSNDSVPGSRNSGRTTPPITCGPDWQRGLSRSMPPPGTACGPRTSRSSPTLAVRQCGRFPMRGRRERRAVFHSMA